MFGKGIWDMTTSGPKGAVSEPRGSKAAAVASLGTPNQVPRALSIILYRYQSWEH